ncbi:hypothetical protein YB2330_002207 [Saitoella coloradoensis]
MPIAHLPTGIHLSYLDSGPPPSSTPGSYTTLLCLHGVAFSASVFTLAAQSAPSKNLRFITYSQRGYTGSTPLSAEEAALTADPVACARDYVEDLVEFLEYLARKEEGVEKVVLVGWSKGTNLCVGLLSPLFTSVSSDIRARGLKHVKSVVLYEPPGNLMGLPLTEDYKAAMLAPIPEGLGKEERDGVVARRFGEWIGGYYEHPDVNSGEYATNPTGHFTFTAEQDWAREAQEPGMVSHGFHWRLALTPREISAISLSAATSSFIPITLLYNRRSAAYLIEAARCWKEWGGNAREIGRGKGNHFWFVEDAEGWLGAVIEAIGELEGKEV